VQIVDAGPFQGQRIRFSAHVRTERSDPECRVSLWFRAQNSDGLVVAFQNMHKRLIVGDTDWSLYSLVLDVPGDAVVVLYGVFAIGAGTLWIDDAAVGAVDLSTPLTDLPYGAANGTLNLPLDPDRILTHPANLDFEDTVPESDTMYWNEREQPTFRSGSPP
jgi:hypothetical protein